MRDYPKKIKRLLREYAIEAHEPELHRELKKLDQSFVEWRNGTIDSGELSYRVHQYEVGPSKELYKQYNYGGEKPKRKQLELQSAQWVSVTSFTGEAGLSTDRQKILARETSFAHPLSKA